MEMVTINAKTLRAGGNILSTMKLTAQLMDPSSQVLRLMVFPKHLLVPL